MVHWLSASSYEVIFDPDLPISEHLISPAAPAESHGMEDARFVRFVEDDGEVTYYATYTAYDGMRILPQMIKTKDFHHFRMTTMSGPTAYHKGSHCSRGGSGVSSPRSPTRSGDDVRNAK